MLLNVYAHVYAHKRGITVRCHRKKRSEKLGMATNTHDGVETGERRGEWKTCKLKEIMCDPESMGKTVRLRDRIFQVRGVLHE